MSQEDVRQRIRAYLTEAVMYRRTAPLADSASLIKAGVLDSLAMLALIAFLEEAFEISVGDDEVEPDNFESIDNLTRFVLRKQGSAEQAA
jgi:acyl carrier protein